MLSCPAAAMVKVLVMDAEVGVAVIWRRGKSLCDSSFNSWKCDNAIRTWVGDGIVGQQRAGSPGVLRSDRYRGFDQRVQGSRQCTKGT